MDFPDYFGHNWDALEECLTDLEWLPGKGYVLLATGAEQILTADEEEFATFLEVLSDVGEAWASGRRVRRVNRLNLFTRCWPCPERDQSKLAHWVFRKSRKSLPRDPAGSAGGDKTERPAYARLFFVKFKSPDQRRSVKVVAALTKLLVPVYGLRPASARGSDLDAADKCRASHARHRRGLFSDELVLAFLPTP